MQAVSRNFAFCAEGNHKGSGIYKNKNIPDSIGNITFTSSLYFLYDKKEKMIKEKGKSMLLSVLACDKGLCPVKKRFAYYGIFGKKLQNNPNQKFPYDDLEQIFIWGQNISFEESNKLDEYMAILERKLGDEKATSKNHRTSPKYKEALEQAKQTNILVVCGYDDAYFNISEDDETKANFSLAYVKFGTGAIPIVSSFERGNKDSLVEVEIGDRKFKNYILNPEGTVTLAVTKSYLKNFGGSEYANLLCRESTQGKFWTVKLKSYTRENVPVDFLKYLPQEVIELIKTVDYVNLEYTLSTSDNRLLNELLEKITQDSLLAFTGNISADLDTSRVSVFENKNTNKKTLSFKIRSGTFYTIRKM